MLVMVVLWDSFKFLFSDQYCQLSFDLDQSKNKSFLGASESQKVKMKRGKKGNEIPHHAQNQKTEKRKSTFQHYAARPTIVF